MNVPLIDLKAQYKKVDKPILRKLKEILSEQRLILGNYCTELEKAIAGYASVPHALACANGTDALILSLMALDIKEGDEVITTPYTFFSTASSILLVGAKPVFVDIEEDDMNIDPMMIRSALTPKTKVILPVHLFGKVCDMRAILLVAHKHGLVLVEDMAQSLGARLWGNMCGTFGDIAAVSFYPTKNMAAYGEGGALTTNDDQIAKYARAARSHGQTARYEHEFVGFNYRMHGFQGAVLRIKLRHLYEWTGRRQEIAREYRRLLAGARLEMPLDDPRDECVYHQFVIYVNNRNAVVSQLAAREIETVVHYPKPVYLQPAYSSLGCPPRSFPNVERACERVLSLPMRPDLTAEQVAYVANAVREIVGSK